MVLTTRSRYTSYLFEGVLVSLIAASMSMATPHIAESITGDREDQWVNWTINIVIGIVSYIIAESFRHGRISVLLSNMKPIGASKMNQARTGFGDSPAIEFAGDNSMFRMSS